MNLEREAGERTHSGAWLRRLLGGLVAGEYPVALWVILGVAFILRMVQASNHGFTIDETPNIEIAESIRLNPANLHLVFHSAGHPLLLVYLIRLGGLVFGPSLVGYRAPMVLIGVLTCLAVYRLARAAGTKGAGLWAAALLAVDQFHVTFSGDLQPAQAPVVLFGTLALLCCIRIKPEARLKPFVGLGVWIALAYLVNEAALVLFAVVWLHMLISRERRAVLRDPRWYLAHAVFALVVAPDLIWNLTHMSTGGYLAFSARKVTSGSFFIQGKFLSLFFGELLMVAYPDILGGAGYWCWPHRVMYWLAGLLYVGAVVWSVRLRRDPVVALLQTTFLLFAFVVTLVPATSTFERYWWGAMAVTPCVILSGILLDRWVRATRWGIWVVAPMLIWFLVRTALILDGIPFLVPPWAF